MNLLKTILYIFFMGIILPLSSCSDQVPDSMFIINLEDEEFSTFINELPLNGGRSMTRLNFQTLDTSYCDNAKLSASAFMDEGSIEIKIHEITLDQNDCGRYAAQPSRNLNIEILEEGDYPVRLQMGANVFYEGSLEVNAEFYRLQIPQAPSINITPEVTYKIPEGAVWYRIYHLPAQDSLAQDCIQTTQQMCTQPSLPDGFYSAFTRTNNSPELTAVDAYPHLQHKDAMMVLNPASHNLSDIEAIFSQYKEAAGHQFIIVCDTWKAERIVIK
jgi:hypothetical protein